MYTSPIVTQTSNITGNLYSTGEEGIYLYSEGNSGDIAFEGKVTTYLPFAFDSDDNTCWLSRTNLTQSYPGRLGISLDKNIILYKIIIKTSIQKT